MYSPMSLSGGGRFERKRKRSMLTRKAVESHAVQIGAGIARCQELEIQRAVQLPLPHLTGPKIPVLYIEMDGTGVPVVPAETVRRCGKNPDEPAHTREVKLGCVFTQTSFDEKGHPCATRLPLLIPGPLSLPKVSAEECTPKPCREAGTMQSSGSFSAMELYGSGTSPIASFQALFRSLISTMPASTSGFSPASCSPPMSAGRSGGLHNFKTSSTKEKSNCWSDNCVPCPGEVALVSRADHRDWLVAAHILRSYPPPHFRRK